MITALKHPHAEVLAVVTTASWMLMGISNATAGTERGRLILEQFSPAVGTGSYVSYSVLFAWGIFEGVVLKGVAYTFPRIWMITALKHPRG